MPVFLEQWTEPAELDAALDEWIALRTSTLGNHGYIGQLHGAQTIAYTRRHTPGLAIFLGIVTFPIGVLLWLLWKRDEVFTVHFESGEDASTLITAKGEAKDAVRWGVVRVARDEAIGVGTAAS